VARATLAVNFHNNTRAPLLLVAGGKDHVEPNSLIKANFELYRQSKAVTDYKEFPERTQYTLGQEGWQEVEDYALDWALRHTSNKSSRSAMSNRSANWSAQL
jgi:hypothetical protein